MALSRVSDFAFLWSDQEHRKVARRLAACIDGDFYLKANPDVRLAGIDPAFHYVKYGWREGRDPSASFSTRAYLADHPELLKDKVNPLLHFLEATPPPAPENALSEAEIALVATELDRTFYIRGYALPEDVDAAAHYCRSGWRSGFDPSPGFSTSHYLSTNIDVRNSGVNPFWHYLVAGRAEGRSPKHEGGWRHDVLARQRPLAKMVEDWVRRDAPPRLLSSDTLVERLAETCRAEQTLISFGHDDYRATSGGVQLCIALEAERAAERGVDYLSITPWQCLPTLAKFGSDPIVLIVLNGRLIGHARMSNVILAALHLGLASPHLALHHLMGHAPEQLTDLAAALGLNEGFLWLHDNFTLCPNYALHRNDVSFCDAPPGRSTACMICLYGEERRDHQARIAALFDALDMHLIAPSKGALEYWTSRTDLTPKSSRVHPHLRLRRRRATSAVPPPARCRIAFVGLPAPHKGWPVFQELRSRLATDDRYEFWHFSSEETARDVRHVSIRCSAGQPDAAADALRVNQIDLVLHWATCRETFSFSTHEALLAGAHVITNAGSGNVAAVVRRQKGGRVFPDTASLFAWVDEGGLLSLAEEARERRTSEAVSASYSRFTLDFLDRESGPT